MRRGAEVANSDGLRTHPPSAGGTAEPSAEGCGGGPAWAAALLVLLVPPPPPQTPVIAVITVLESRADDPPAPRAPAAPPPPLSVRVPAKLPSSPLAQAVAMPILVGSTWCELAESP